ncbi:hypothetical protein KQX54_010083 [Cotesia glomerata]|uniref:Profilin n=1 Tax=Cotesia glomerata TaxID=32391 RepID=A0AAV7J2E2_COTGL|nr:hypothetical protein KQX54_010083 [Cotesia glomerata]
MSWQDYIDKQLLASRCVTKAAIAGHDGNLWAKSDGFEVSTLLGIILSGLTVLSTGIVTPRTTDEAKAKGLICSHYIPRGCGSVVSGRWTISETERIWKTKCQVERDTLIDRLSLSFVIDHGKVSKEELAKLVQGFDTQEILTSSGVTLAGNRYIYLSGTDRVIRAKLGKVGVHCMKTSQAVVVSLYEDPIQPQQAASVVEKLGDYLITCGY